MRGPIDPEKLNLMKAALPNVAFDGWSPSTFSAACEEANIPENKAKLICPRGAVDLASTFHDTSVLIWQLIGDESEDFNWYSKRTILSAVYASTVLFWLGDDSEGSSETWHFLNRRIEDVMTFEKVKAQLKTNKYTKNFNGFATNILKNIKKPNKSINTNLPGHLDIH